MHKFALNPALRLPSFHDEHDRLVVWRRCYLPAGVVRTAKGFLRSAASMETKRVLRKEREHRFEDANGVLF
uniref:Uncharacterized protein n=1 Tax=Plectus sambesii TaxID=2011161 RepID=A0A914UJV0_9BILA